jgi:nicotinate dehydrogenase subunit B
MAPVVVQLQALPDSDIRAIAEYVASFDQRNQGDDPAALEQAAAARLALTAGAGNGARIFGGSCAACHEGGAPHMFGNRPSLALNSNLYAARPDNLIRVILNGSTAALPGGGAMPSFRDVLNDTQLADLITYLRATFAPGAPAWADLPRRIVALRQAHPP